MKTPEWLKAIAALIMVCVLVAVTLIAAVIYGLWTMWTERKRK